MRQAVVRRAVALVFLVGAACTASHGAVGNDASSPSMAVTSAPSPKAPTPSEPERETFYGGVIRVTWSECSVDTIAHPTNTNRIRFRTPYGPDGVRRKTMLDIGMLDHGRSVEELEAYIEGLGDVGPGLGSAAALEEQAPPYFDNSLQGSVSRGAPHVGEGPLKGSSALGLDAGWSGTWIGPRGGATPGTYAVICYEHSVDGWRSVGIAGPVKVRRINGGRR